MNEFNAETPKKINPEAARALKRIRTISLLLLLPFIYYMRTTYLVPIHPYSKITKLDFEQNSREGLAILEVNGVFGFINKKGKEEIPLKYDSASSFEGGLADVSLKGKKGFVDTKGNEYWDMTRADAFRQMRNR